MNLFGWGEEIDPEQMERLINECEVMEAERAEAIAAAIKNNPCHHFDGLGDFIVGRHITVVEIIDAVGDAHLVPITSRGMLRWEALGMLRAATE